MTMQKTLYFLTLTILTISITAFASQEKPSTIVDAETAAKIESQIHVYYDTSEHRLSADGKKYEIFINDNNELDFMRCDINGNSKETTCTPLTNQSSQYNPDDECQKLCLNPN